ncbi:MAG TPA: trehalose-phosphatase [Thermomicrobiales bacterium]|nr:trehalose-phosphatase [Thermomicrobiales bacterium]
MKAASVADVLDKVIDVLRHEPAGVLADFDGTLSPIAPVPEAAILHPALVDVLPLLKDQLNLLAVITGRAASDAQAKVGVVDMLYVGNHGLEWLEGGDYEAHPAGVEAQQGIVSALTEIEADLRNAGVDVGGFVFENKRLSASIHYRVAADPERVEAILPGITAARAAEHGLQMTTGKMMVELRPTSTISKGSALVEIASRRGLKGVVFLGDDITDVDAFRSLRRMREDGTIASGLAIGVLSEEVKQPIVDESDILLEGVDAVAELLVALSAHLTR